MKTGFIYTTIGLTFVSLGITVFEENIILKCGCLLAGLVLISIDLYNYRLDNKESDTDGVY